jgi:A/G-specific adenine glycosylase
LRDENELAPPQAETLLEWYDHQARTLPWRIPPAQSKAGVLPDPYRVWMSEIMLQQTTVAAVKAYFERFTTLWPTVQDLAGAKDEDVMAEWAGLGYYARARNLLKCARIVTLDHNGQFPETVEELGKLPGVGPYTSAAISSIAFGRSATVVDGNVERVMARLFDEHTPLPTAKGVLTEYAATLTPDVRAGDYAQAVMDLGATVCTPKNPACGLCPWRKSCCAWFKGTQADLPKKLAKAKKPTRYGIAYVARRIDGAYLLETRPEKGLLGGMLGWPGTDWNEVENPLDTPPIRAEWKTLPSEVRHTFTHFHLRLTVKTALVPLDRQPTRGEFILAEEFSADALPTVMKKCFTSAR